MGQILLHIYRRLPYHMSTFFHGNRMGVMLPVMAHSNCRGGKSNKKAGAVRSVVPTPRQARVEKSTAEGIRKDPKFITSQPPSATAAVVPEDQPSYVGSAPRSRSCPPNGIIIHSPPPRSPLCSQITMFHTLSPPLRTNSKQINNNKVTPK